MSAAHCRRYVASAGGRGSGVSSSLSSARGAGAGRFGTTNGRSLQLGANNSPLRGRARPDALARVDINGQCRFADGEPDIGAFEVP